MQRGVVERDILKERDVLKVRGIVREKEKEIFKISRKYEELRERLGVEMIYNKSKYLPCNETEVEGDKGNNDFINYLVVTNNTDGDRTITNHDRLYEFAENDENLNGICIYDVNIRDSIISNVYRYKIRLFDDGGQIFYCVNEHLIM